MEEFVKRKLFALIFSYASSLAFVGYFKLSSSSTCHHVSVSDFSVFVSFFSVCPILYTYKQTCPNMNSKTKPTMRIDKPARVVVPFMTQGKLCKSTIQ